MKINRIFAGVLLLMAGNQLMGQNNPPDISLVFYLIEESPAGTIVGAVNATDPDGDPLSYAIISGNTDNAFAINTTTGEITVSNATAIDFATNPVFDLMVEASDGNGGITVAAITINILEKPLGIADQNGMLIYPNPARDVFVVSLNNADLLRNVSIDVFSLSGQKINTEQTLIGTNEIQVVLKNRVKGVHMVIVSGEKEVYSNKRIVIQ